MRDSWTQLSQGSISISLIDLLIGLSLACLLGLGIALVYRLTHRGLHYERSFLVTLMMMPAIVAVVMMLIGSNLALSLGMVGALSIIRFRTVIKDSRDMVFLFFGIATGLGCGTYNWMVTVVTTAVISGVLLVLHLVRYSWPVHADYVLVLTGEGHHPDGDVKEVIRRHVGFLQLRSLEIHDGAWEMVFEIRLFKDGAATEGALLDDLNSTFTLQRASLLAPQLSLPV